MKNLKDILSIKYFIELAIMLLLYVLYDQGGIKCQSNRYYGKKESYRQKEFVSADIFKHLFESGGVLCIFHIAFTSDSEN